MMLGYLMSEKKLSSDIIFEIKDEIKKSQDNFESIFSVLKTQFEKNELCEIYSKLLGEIKTPNFLQRLIKEIDKLRHPKNLDDLIDFIMDCDKKDFSDILEYVNLKVLCIKAISNFKNTKAVPVLLYCLNDKNGNYKFRLAAAEALGKIGDKEVDFIALKGEEKIYYQVSELITNEDTRKCEIEALRDIGDSYPKVILTTDILQTGTTEDGIKIVNLIDWLLEDN